ncbi:CMRF35-like molecule 5 [Megalops cyprinoides]|uniref:CMRF35-like molecule 5 n=1 Tax=Megalops cyprinoides TaxID=118141 RepID=UPI0018647E2A|nr:CMRF35-like molecule 5 [Megalops cyprinoides]
MRNLLIVTFCLIAVRRAHSGKTITATGHEGGNVEIKCSYLTGYEKSLKYLCNGECEWPNKNIQIETEQGQIRARKGRFSLYDDRTARVFAVTITGLTLEDAGTYWCGIRGLLIDVFTEVDLIVKRDSTAAPLPPEEDAAHTESGSRYSSDSELRMMCLRTKD